MNTVGFVGLGGMGSGLAHHLQKHQSEAGHVLLVNNRTKDKPSVDKLLKEGAEWAASPSEMAGKCDVVFSMLTNDAALEAVFKDYLAGGPKKGSIYVDCSTVYPDLTSSNEKAAASHGITYLASNIIGRPDATMAGQSLILLAGAPQAKQKVAPLIRCMGRGVVDVGDEARQANVLKLATNYFIASMTQLIGEGMTLAEKNGVDRQAVVKVLTETFRGPITKGYAEQLARDEFEMTAEAPGFSARGGLKDTSHVQKLARASGVPMAVNDAVVHSMQQIVDRGAGDRLEWCSAALLIREAAGIPGAKEMLG